MPKIAKYFARLLPKYLEKRLRTFRDTYLRQYDVEDLPPGIWAKDQKYHSISFCTTCMNRLYQLQNTLEQNIQSNIDYPKIEFILVNYNSQDQLHEWVHQHLMKYIEAGILNYYHTTEPDHFHGSIAKNLAHKLAKGEVLCNLDGDNFTGNNFARYINFLFNKYGMNHIFHFYRRPFWGTFGRIAYTKENFLDVGGYDESFQPMGFQDTDLIKRFQALGMSYKNVQVDNFLRHLSNNTHEKTFNLSSQNKDWYEITDANSRLSKLNLEKGNLIANKNIPWGQGKVYKNFDTNPITVK